MKRKSGTSLDTTGKLVRALGRKSRTLYPNEERIRIVSACLREEGNICAP